MSALDTLRSWSPWIPLERCWSGDRIPQQPGLYRIRRGGRTDLDYIGQTGLTLRQPLAMLAGVYGEVMPYRDPHTAGPTFAIFAAAAGNVAFDPAVKRVFFRVLSLDGQVIGATSVAVSGGP